MLAKLKLKNSTVSETSQLVIVSPNTGEWLPYRKWPIDYYVELARKLLQSHENVYVLISGSRSAKDDGVYIEKHVNHPRLLNLVCQTSFREFIDLLGISKVVVSVDSGPAHFACLTDIGIVCIFGPDTQEVFAPLSRRAISIESGLACHPCFSAFNARRPNCNDQDKPCLRSIAVERVYPEVARFLV